MLQYHSLISILPQNLNPTIQAQLEGVLDSLMALEWHVPHVSELAQQSSTTLPSVSGAAAQQVSSHSMPPSIIPPAVHHTAHQPQQMPAAYQQQAQARHQVQGKYIGALAGDNQVTHDDVIQ